MKLKTHLEKDDLEQNSSRRRDSIEQSFVVVTLAIGFILIACVLGSDSIVATFISVLSFLGYFVYCLVIRPSSLFKYLAVYFAVVANIVGCFVVETNEFYLSEMQMDSGFAGSLPSLIVSRWIFVVAVIVFDYFLQSSGDGYSLKRETDKIKRDYIFTILCLCLLIVLGSALFCVVTKPPSFVLGLDRFRYAQEISMPGILTRIMKMMPYLIYVSILATKFKPQRILGAICILFWIVYLFWTGEKFGSFFALAVAFLLVYYDELSVLLKRSKGKLLAICFAGFVVIVCGAVVVAGAQLGFSDYGAYFNSRLSQQGQLWWANYKVANQEKHFDQIQSEIEGLGASADIADNVGSNHGVYGVMYRTVPGSVVDAKLAGGSRYTEGGYPAVYYVFGIEGTLIFSVLMAFIFVGCLTLLIFSVRSSNVILLVVCARFFLLLQPALSMGVYSDFFDFASICSYLYLLIFALYRFSSARNIRQRES